MVPCSLRGWMGLTLCCTLISLSVGCGSDNRLETATVSGKVSYNGDPLAIGSLLFVPVGGGPSAQANIEPDGSYSMGTYELTDGAIPGEHKVMITAITAPGGSGLPEDAVGNDGAPVSVIPEHFGNLEKSGLVITVKSGKNNVDFVLTSTTGEVKVN